MSVIEHFERIAICQHPNGENVWWATDEPEPTCAMDCACTPKVYVAEDQHRGAVEALREYGKHRPDCATTRPGPFPGVFAACDCGLDRRAPDPQLAGAVSVVEAARAIAESFTAPNGDFIPDNLTESEWRPLRDALNALDGKPAFDEEGRTE